MPSIAATTRCTKMQHICVLLSSFVSLSSFLLLFFSLCVVFCFSCGRKKIHLLSCLFHLLFSSGLHNHILLHIIILFFSYRNRSSMYRIITSLTIHDWLQNRISNFVRRLGFDCVPLSHLLCQHTVRQPSTKFIGRGIVLKKDHHSTKLETPHRLVVINCIRIVDPVVTISLELSKKTCTGQAVASPKAQLVCPSISSWDFFPTWDFHVCRLFRVPFETRHPRARRNLLDTVYTVCTQSPQLMCL